MPSAAVYAKDYKDVSEWLRSGHDWQEATEAAKLKKLEVKVKMCCSSCEEKVTDAVLGLPGVFDCKTERINDLLTIAETPGEGPNHTKLLRKLKKVDKKAEILKPSPSTNTSTNTKTNTSTTPSTTPSTCSSTNMVFVLPPYMGPCYTVPWIPATSAPWSFVPCSYWQHRVSCGQCLGCTDVVCSNCGRGSEMGAYP